MPLYRLVFSDDGIGVARYIEFEGRSAASALEILSGERDSRRAELWTEGSVVAEILLDRFGIWQISEPSCSVASQ